jgi:holo-[acyl-carrier protein] synthase
VILGLGLDNVQNKRMKEILVKWSTRVEDRVFTEAELEYSKKKGETHLHLAARFAAKEALFKALGKGLSDGMTWTDVEVRNDPSGKPFITLKARAQEIADQMGVKKIHTSLSHTDECSIAVVILEG